MPSLVIEKPLTGKGEIFATCLAAGLPTAVSAESAGINVGYSRLRANHETVKRRAFEARQKLLDDLRYGPLLGRLAETIERGTAMEAVAAGKLVHQMAEDNQRVVLAIDGIKLNPEFGDELMQRLAVLRDKIVDVTPISTQAPEQIDPKLLELL